MTTAFVLGNGQSRKDINLAELNRHGKIYGCNALYRDYVPDVLIAVDKKISEQIQNNGYAQRHRLYTRRPLPGLGAKRVPEHYWGFSSGQIAMAIAAADGNRSIYLLGFDLGSTDNRFNNVYADSEFYKKSSDRPTFSGNWIKQTVQIAKDYRDLTFVRVTGPATAKVNEFDSVHNIQHITIQEFSAKFGI